MHQRPPPVVFGFVKPVTRLGECQFQWAAVDWPGRIRAGLYHGQRFAPHALSFLRPLVLIMAMIGQTWLRARFCWGLKAVCRTVWKSGTGLMPSLTFSASAAW